MFEETRNALRDVGLSILRVGAGGIMLLAHGWPKWTGWADKADAFPDPFGVGAAASLGLAVFAELFCSALVVLGAATRFAVVPLIVTMAVAALVVHGSDPWADKEAAVMFLIPFLTLLFTGPGRLSVDAFVRFAKD